MQFIVSPLFLTLLFLFSGCVMSQKEMPPPAFYLQHPQPIDGTLYGVGRGETFLEAKLKALDDIATQLNSRVHAITTVNKTGNGPSEVNQQITVLTRKDIGNYTIVEERRVGDRTYLLLSHRIIE